MVDRVRNSMKDSWCAETATMTTDSLLERAGFDSKSFRELSTDQQRHARHVAELLVEAEINAWRRGGDN